MTPSPRRSAWLYSTVGAVLVALVMTLVPADAAAAGRAVAAPPRTATAQCDALTAARTGIASRGYRLRCDPTIQGVSITGTSVLGWVQHPRRIAWVWQDRIARLPNAAAVLRKVVTHEWGHIEQTARGRSNAYWRYVRSLSSSTTEQQVREDYAEVFSYCKDRQSGVGYTFRAGRPTAAQCRML